MRIVPKTILVGVFAAALPAQTPSFAPAAVVNAATFASEPIAPREIVTILGTGLGPAALVTCATPYPTSCGGSSVLVNGEAAPIYFASASEINFEAPVDLSGSSATLEVTTEVSGQTLKSTAVTIPVTAVAPGIFTTTQNNLTIGEFIRVTGDSVISASNPALPGDVLTVYGTGFGQTNPVGTSGSPPSAGAQLVAPVKITVAGLAATMVVAAPAPFLSGADQANFVVPLAVTSGNLSVVVTAGGQAAPSVLLPVVLKPVITGDSNNASGAAGIESGSWVSIYGGGLSATTRIWQASDFSGNNLPLALDGVSVTIDGRSAAVYYISPVQLNVQAPADTASGPVQVVVTNSYGVGDGTTTLQPFALGFFSFQAKYPAAVHSDGVLVAPVGYFGSSTVSRPAQPGEILAIYGTGFGPTNPATPAGQIVSGAAPLSYLNQLQVTIGGVPATVQFAGIVAAGEYQLNVTVPQLANGDQPILATIGGFSSQTGLAIPVQN
jgi:uncharacterized protein (TIGR03437 family)